MHEHLAQMLYYFQVHLLFASLVWLAAWILTSIPGGGATMKYWIWLAAGLNFILPLGAVVDRLLALHLSWATPLSVAGDVGVEISHNASLATATAVTWLLGATWMFTRLCLRIRAEHRDCRIERGESALKSRRNFLVKGIRVRFVNSRHAPAVSGILRPCILLPDGIDRFLKEHELKAVLIHELTHAKRRDNLISLIYELALCGLWFHPFVWLTGSRIALYRELSSDEAVLQNNLGADLVSALARLANPEANLLLQAAVSSFISQRLVRLNATQPRGRWFGTKANMVLAVTFGVVFVAGVFGTVAHTACCFVVKKSYSGARPRARISLKDQTGVMPCVATTTSMANLRALDEAGGAPPKEWHDLNEPTAEPQSLCAPLKQVS